MKRGKPLQSKGKGSSAGAPRAGIGKKPRKALKQVNPERQAKRRKSYAQKLAAYKRSETYRIVEARAQGQCERVVIASGRPVRCWNTREGGRRMTHNHKRYGRQFGGSERPEDVELLCDFCNAQYESQHPTRNRNYRRSA